jgi:hypothetical protein
VILEGESLLNDATALLVYRLAVSATMGMTFTGTGTAILSLAMVGSAVVGFLLAHAVLRVTERITDVPSAIILQFVTAFGVDPGGRSWPFTHRDPGHLRDHRGTSHAGTHAGSDAHPLLRSVGDGGLRPQRTGLRAHRVAAAAYLRGTGSAATRAISADRGGRAGVVVVVRMAWVMLYNGPQLEAPVLRRRCLAGSFVPTVSGSLVVGWAGCAVS